MQHQAYGVTTADPTFEIQPYRPQAKEKIMDSRVPKDWEKDSDNRFIHETNIRIQRMT